jgi:hypothetical protein
MFCAVTNSCPGSSLAAAAACCRGGFTLSGTLCILTYFRLNGKTFTTLLQLWNDECARRGEGKDTVSVAIRKSLRDMRARPGNNDIFLSIQDGGITNILNGTHFDTLRTTKKH